MSAPAVRISSMASVSSPGFRSTAAIRFAHDRNFQAPSPRVEHGRPHAVVRGESAYGQVACVALAEGGVERLTGRQRPIESRVSVAVGGLSLADHGGVVRQGQLRMECGAGSVRYAMDRPSSTLVDEM